jgi:thioredoxin 1
VTVSDANVGKYNHVTFVKLDVDEVSDVAQELGIRAMPTFIIFKDGVQVDQVVGANPAALGNGIVKHAGEKPKA